MSGVSDLKSFDSPFNQKASQYVNRRINKKIEIYDLTLEADGEEMAGLRFKHSERIEIAKILNEAGIHRIAIIGNSPKPTKGDIKSAEKIVELGLKTRTSGFVKTIAEITTCYKIGLKDITILVGVNEKTLSPGTNGKTIIDNSKQLIDHAKTLGLHVTFMGMDTTRATPEFLKYLFSQLEPMFDEYAIGDSLGRMTPFGIQYLVELISSWTCKPIQLHPHNTTSMATANCLSAVLNGVSVLHSSINGLGEFAGLSATEECTAAIEVHAGIPLGINFSKLQEASKLVSKITGIPIPPNKPITGKTAFAIPETEEIQEFMFKLHLEGRFNLGMPLIPDLVGAKRIFSIGRKCNPYTIIFNLNEHGYAITFENARKLARDVREHLKRRRGHYLMEDTELVEFYKKTSYFKGEQGTK